MDPWGLIITRHIAVSTMFGPKGRDTVNHGACFASAVRIRLYCGALGSMVGFRCFGGTPVAREASANHNSATITAATATATATY